MYNALQAVAQKRCGAPHSPFPSVAPPQQLTPSRARARRAVRSRAAAATEAGEEAEEADTWAFEDDVDAFLALDDALKGSAGACAVQKRARARRHFAV